MYPAYVLWATAKLVDVEKLSDRTVVVRFDMRDRPAERYWMVLRKPQLTNAFLSWIRPSPYADVVRAP
jgi:hypothetical protein